MRPIGFPLPNSLGLALLSLFPIFIASASAQDAWVLWNETNSTFFPTPEKKEGSESHTWHVIMAAPSKEKCEAEGAWTITEMAKAPDKSEKVEVKGNMVFITSHSPDGRIIATRNHRLICLPDTIDPRKK
jgi:hypothetical protein